jgi:hypothetical protein
MIALVLCVLALGSCYWAGKRSLGLGMVCLVTWGYFYGILRANLLTTFMYFLFDAALLGFYLSQKGLLTGGGKRSSALRTWSWVLMLWPAVMMVMPFQPFLVSLVGLRGSILYIPMMLAGSRLRDNDLRQLTFGFAALNLVSLAFGGAEYFMGIQRFFPENAATILIYGSRDVAGGFYRIPAIFTTAHLYGGTMATSIPYLIGGWERALTPKTRLFMLMGIAAAFLGVLLSTTRVNILICCGLAVAMVLNGRMSARNRAVIAMVVLIMIGVALKNTRFQRFKELGDTEFVQERISGSVNRGFFEVLVEYPMGNGLGGGGTNIPAFLAGQVRSPVGMENEYGRILLEQGVIGLLLWVGFVVWFLSCFGSVFAKGPWATSRRLIWLLSVFSLGIGVIGTGLLTAMPTTPILLLGIGWVATPMRKEAGEMQPAGITRARLQPRGFRPVPSET